MRKFRPVAIGAIVAGTLLAGVGAAGAASLSASNGSEKSEKSAAACTWVRQYRVTQDGDLVDRNSGAVIGAAYAGDTLNAREFNINSRHYGVISATGKYGGVLTSKLSYLGDACV